MLALVSTLLFATACPTDGPTNRYDGHGQPVGLWLGWHSNGVLAFEQCYVGGRLQGVAASWYADGRLQQRGAYDHGAMIGRWLSWDVYGNVLEMEYGTGGQGYVPKKNGHWTYYGPRGVIGDGDWIDDKQHGLWRNWYAGGHSEQHYDHGLLDGESRTFDAAGAVTNVTHYRAGVLHGTETSWSGQYKTHEAEYVDGERHGSFTQWIGGVATTEGHYVHGRMDGEWTGKHANGAARFVNHYDHGVLDGVWLQWDADGRVTADQMWRRGKRVR